MKWVLIFLLIGCTDTDDMRLFQSSLSNQSDTPPFPIDGGECIFLTPDASGGDVGHGFTCTGLFFKDFNNGNPQFWVGNDGRNQEGGSTDFKASVVLVELPYDDSGNSIPATNTGIKIGELFVETIQDGSVQGVVQANDGTLWVAIGSNIINITSTPLNGIPTELSRFTVTDANGLAYDYTDDTLLIKANNDVAIKRYSTSGALLDANVVEVNAAVDQIFLDYQDNDILYVTSGSNNSPMAIRRLSISDSFTSTYFSITDALAAEGVSVVYHSDGKQYVYGASDAYFHYTGVPAGYDINAIFKVLPNF